MGEIKTLTTPWQREGRGWVPLFWGAQIRKRGGGSIRLDGELIAREVTVMKSHCTSVSFFFHHSISHSLSCLNRISPPSLSPVSLFPSSSLCPFRSLSTVDVFVWRESPGAADAQFWVILAGVILSHTGPLINEPL